MSPFDEELDLVALEDDLWARLSGLDPRAKFRIAVRLAALADREADAARAASLPGKAHAWFTRPVR